MRFNIHRLKPYQEAISRLPGANGVGIGAENQVPTLEVNATSDEAAALIDKIVADRVEVTTKVNIQTIGEVRAFAAAAAAEPSEKEQTREVLDAIGTLPGVTYANTAGSRLVVNTGSTEDADFLSKLMEDTIDGRDVYFRIMSPAVAQ